MAACRPSRRLAPTSKRSAPSIRPSITPPNGLSGVDRPPDLGSILHCDVEHRHRHARDADKLVLLIADADLPDMQRLAELDRAGDAGDIAAARRPHMVGVDLDADAMMLRPVDDEGGAPRGERLGERSEEHTSELQSPDHL